MNRTSHHLSSRFPSLVLSVASLIALSCSCPEPYVDGATCYAGYCPCSNPGELACYAKDATGDDVFACRPAEECEGVPTSAQPEPQPECRVDADCPAPAEPRCAERQCVAGTCSFKLHEGARLESQRPGDCGTVYCSILGEALILEDPADYPNDGNECTMDLCIGGKPVNEPFDDGLPCPESASGVCLAGHCTACYEPLDAFCPGGLSCTMGLCVPMTCDNGVQDGDETYFDCGGPCKPCFPGESCKVDEDCQSKQCKESLCTAPSSTDGVQNDGETGKDCGCASCVKKCETGEGCSSSEDCISAVCYAGVCQPATCTDATVNGDETGEDCGGSCAPCPTES